MNLNDLMNLVLNNLNDLKIEYSNINGKESLKVNGEEICNCTKQCKCNKYDDSKLVKRIESHKALLNKLDDCTFMEVVDYLKNDNINLSELNKFMDKESYTKDDELIADDYIEIVSNAMQNVIIKKMSELRTILDQI